MKKILILLVSLAFFSSAFAQWQFGVGFQAVNKAARFSESSLPLGSSTAFSVRTPSLEHCGSDWFLNGGLTLQGGSSGVKCVDINEDISRLYDNRIVAHTVDMRYGRWFNDWIVYSEAIAGHMRIQSAYEEKNKGECDVLSLSNSRVLRYGIGLGVGYQFNDEFKLELSTRFTRSGSVDYLDMDSIRLLEAGTSNVAHTINTSDYSDLISFGLTFVYVWWQ
jgi:opacity protein-like surface antigen